jgi:hypothetical protein
LSNATHAGSERQRRAGSPFPTAAVTFHYNCNIPRATATQRANRVADAVLDGHRPHRFTASTAGETVVWNDAGNSLFPEPERMCVDA